MPLESTMLSGRDMREPAPCSAHPAPRVRYAAPDTAPGDGTLAVLRFRTAPSPDDPRVLHVPFAPLGEAMDEYWEVGGPVTSGRDGGLRWARGGGWLFAAIDVLESDHGGPENAAAFAYEALSRRVSAGPERHVQRIWNYLGAINEGDGDDERYKHFCTGRIRGMGEVFAQGFPAASALGHHGDADLLQVYLLATDQTGTRVENPRQVSAWRYPRQYGRTPPSFARATMLPCDDVLAISGTAAVVGHASAHVGDIDAQLEETARNLDALLESAGLPAGFHARDPLKAYVRHAEHADTVRAFVENRWPGTPLLMVLGDVCRRELLVEIDGWRYR